MNKDDRERKRYPVEFGALAAHLSQQMGVPLSKEFRELQRDADAVCRLGARRVLSAAERDRAELRLARRAVAAAERRNTGRRRRSRSRRTGGKKTP